jgi:hypothetical protein
VLGLLGICREQGSDIACQTHYCRSYSSQGRKETEDDRHAENSYCQGKNRMRPGIAPEMTVEDAERYSEPKNK